VRGCLIDGERKEREKSKGSKGRREGKGREEKEVGERWAKHLPE